MSGRVSFLSPRFLLRTCQADTSAPRARETHSAGGNSLDLPDVSGEVLSHHRLLFLHPRGPLAEGRRPKPNECARAMRGGVWCDDCRVIWFRLFFCFDCVPPFGGGLQCMRSKSLCTLYTYVNYEEQVRILVHCLV